MHSLPSSSRTLYALLFPVAALSAMAGVAQAPAAAPTQSAPAPQSTSTAKPEPAATSTVLHTNADLVLVDIVVTDHGSPIHGLDKRLFHVLEDEHEQTISSFDEHRSIPTAAGAAPSRAPLPPNTFTNVPVYPETQTVNVLLLDGLNTPVPDQMRVRQQMLQFMGGIQPGTPLAIFTLSSRLRMVKAFTTDPAELIRALTSRKAAPQTSVVLDPAGDAAFDASVGDMASSGANSDAIAMMQQFVADLTAFQTDQRVRMTLDAMQQLARYLSAIPGRKNVIWFSGSFPITLDPDPTLNNSFQSPFDAMRTYYDDVRETSDLLAAARVAVYPVDARGLMTLPSLDATKSSASTNLVTGTSSGGRGSARQSVTVNRPSFGRDDAKFMQQLTAEQASMKLIAEETGGQEYINTNGLKEAVAKAVENGGSYYTVGYVPAARPDDGNFHKIQVKTDNAAYKLAYRRGYYADPPDKHSAHTPEKVSLTAAALLPGAPPATQIWFSARVLPATDPLFKDLKMPDAPASDAPSALKGPLHRYIVDMKVDPHWLNYESDPDGARKASVEFVLVAYDNESRRVNYVDRGFQLNIKPDQYSRFMSSSIPARLLIDLPPGQIALRIAVHDLTAGHAGSLEVPLFVAAK
jgi:VWFA-related protein